MPEDYQYGRNTQNILTKLIKFVVVDGSKYVSFNMIYHNKRMNLTTTKSFLKYHRIVSRLDKSGFITRLEQEIFSSLFHLGRQ